MAALNFRETTNLREINHLLRESKAVNSFVWQSREDGRAIYQIGDIQFNDSLHTVQFSLVNYNNDLVTKGTDTYIKLDNKETVFKGRVISIINNTLAIHIPKEVRTLELRKFPRTRFKPSTQKVATIQLTSPIIRSAVQAISFTTIDISEKGISLIITVKNKDLFEKSSVFELTLLDGNKLKHTISMDLCYFQKLRYKSGGRVIDAFRAGLEFKTMLPRYELDFFTNNFDL